MAIVDDAMDHVGGAALFTQGGLDFLRDAWIAARVAELRQAEAARVVKGKFPDFEINVGGTVEEFEAVETYEVGRRRGVEYRDADGQARDAEIESATEIRTQLEAACRSKVEKLYSKPVNLVIYLNTFALGVEEDEREALIRSATTAAAGAFTSVWVLWQETLYQAWHEST